MIAPSSMALLSPGVVRKPGRFADLMDALRDDAALEMGAAFEGVMGKRIDRANVPGCGRHGVSRAMNGSDTNPLYRIAALLVLMKRLGMGRARAQRWVDWLQGLVNVIWGDEPPPFDEVMEKESDLDSADDPHQTRAILGCADALRQWIAIKRESRAYDAVAIRAAEYRLAAMTTPAGGE